MTRSSLARRRSLRRNATDAEKALWSLLRDRQLGGLKFRRQHQTGPYILDFYCPSHQLAVELDGEQHFEPASQVYDARRTAWLGARGIAVIRFTNLEALAEKEFVMNVLWCRLNRGLPP